MRAGTWLVRLAMTIAGSALAIGQSTGSIEGTVTDSVTQTPVRKAQVMLIGGAAGPRTPVTHAVNMGLQKPPSLQPSVAVTDAGGSFVFRDLIPGRYTVQVQHPRFPMRSSGPVTVHVEVKASEASRAMVSLVPGASISGRIVDEDGDPIPACNVQLRAPSGSSPLAMRGVGFEAQPSNERGEYRVHRLSAGKYIAVVQCMRPAFQPRPFSSGPPPPPSLGYPLQYYPQAADFQSAAAIEVAAGAERTGIDFRLKPVRVYTVSGTLNGVESSDGPNATVMLAAPDQSGFGMRSDRVDPATGGFVLTAVIPGSYILTANQYPAQPQAVPMTAWQPIEVTDRSLQVNLMMRKAVDIPGAIVIEGDRPVPPQQVHIQLMALPPAFGMLPRVELQPDGTFTLKSVVPGVWRLSAYGPNVFLRAIEAGGQTLDGQTLDTSKGMPGSLRIFISTRTATVRATGTPGLMYTFLKEGETNFPRPHLAQADPQGAFKLEGLAPGKYKVYEGTVPDDAMLLQTTAVNEAAVVELDLSKRPASGNPR